MNISEAASKAEDIQKKILANQKTDKKDAKTEPELIPKSDVWVPDSSIVHNENTYQINWNRIKNSMSKLKFSDQLKETVASVTANIKGLFNFILIFLNNLLNNIFPIKQLQFF